MAHSIATGLACQIAALASPPPNFGRGGVPYFKLGDYEIDSLEESLSLYRHTVQLQRNRLRTVATVFLKLAKRNGWLAHSDSWQQLAAGLGAQ